ncbi:MAG: arsenosugar biosynthesis radical SAM protein ArsS [Gemmataceae bacterium]|nr:arsenosugar biosynthesis radical SAM protein ArsS [Gemmataceae bacterium]MDW8242334.1 arsenosugar biosynthesis radical SAM protein ArsS [Thermogemmata sp.]
MARFTLHRQGHPLADPAYQCQILGHAGHKPFAEALAESGLHPLRAQGIRILQINLGKLCNQTCRHCHVDAGPDRREIMSWETLQLCRDVLARSDIAIVDITGGAPELHPHFRWFVREIRQLGRHVIDRCNLTVLLTPPCRQLPEFLAEHQVEIIASLPCYLPENVDAQRGEGVFEQSITALRQLNALGYGQPGSQLRLNLVYNPAGPSLPPPQDSLEVAYRRELRQRYGIVFHNLYTLTNMPISRFLDDLLHQGRFDEYMQKLIAAYNPAAAQQVMCRTTLSVGWDGRLYDCDFNQMLQMGLAPGLPQHIRDFDPEPLQHRPITIGQHCYGCTAGRGSSCQGALLTSDERPAIACDV